MIKRKSLKSILSILLIMATLVSALSMTGCSSKNNIVGTWYRVDDDEVSENGMSFYKDGTCIDTPVTTLTSAEAVSYKIQEDGMLIFTMEWDGPIKYEKTEDKELALDDWDYYYLSGDTLILRSDTYVRK